MKNKTIRFKITLWFSVSLIIVVILSFVSFMTVSKRVVKHTTINVLQEAVEQNLDEVEYHDEMIDDELDFDADYYMKYKDGWLEIDDDYLTLVNGVTCAVYDFAGGTRDLIFGEDPIAAETKNTPFENRQIQNIKIDEINYYIYDRKVKNKGVEDIWIRGVISGEQSAGEITDISKLTVTILLLILLIAIIGGNIIAGRMLDPMKQITEAASQISRGNDLKKRIDIGEGKDEVHRLADSFNNMMTRLDEAFEREQQFTSDVSHELRTPISVIMAQSEFALENGETEEDYIDALGSINRQSRKMSRLVNDMLAFARLGKEKSVYTKESLNLSEICRSICDEMALIGDKNIRLESEICPNIHIEGNEELISRLLVNLIGNAYKYGKENGNIRVELTADRGQAMVSVTDDGIGISEEDLPKVFNRFYQADSSRTDKGSGLGLFMAKEIAQFHNGDIFVESRLGEGSRFFVKIKIL